MGKFLTADPEIYCLFNKESENLNVSIFEVGHLYLIVFIFSFLNKLGINALILSSIIFALNFSLIILAIYFYLKKKKFKNFVFSFFSLFYSFGYLFQ
jgi:hypothetical protein